MKKTLALAITAALAVIAAAAAFQLATSPASAGPAPYVTRTPVSTPTYHKGSSTPAHTPVGTPTYTKSHKP